MFLIALAWTSFLWVVFVALLYLVQWASYCINRACLDCHSFCLKHSSSFSNCRTKHLGSTKYLTVLLQDGARGRCVCSSRCMLFSPRILWKCKWRKVQSVLVPRQKHIIVQCSPLAQVSSCDKINGEQRVRALYIRLEQASGADHLIARQTQKWLNGPKLLSV